ncbi:MAG: hypothetical protein WDW38_008512 [Sanguina aurantia]
MRQHSQCIVSLILSAYSALGNTSHSSSGTAQWRPSFDLTARASLVPAVNHPGPQDILPFLYATATPGEPRSVLSSIEAFSEHYPMYIVGKEKANLLRAVVAAAAPRLVVEVGSFIGYSAVAIASTLPPGGRMVCVDACPDCVETAQAVLKLAGLSDKVSFELGLSSNVVPGLAARYGAADVVFEDHCKECYARDLVAMEEGGLVVGGTWLVADNVLYPGAPDLLAALRDRERYAAALVPYKYEYDQSTSMLRKVTPGSQIAATMINHANVATTTAVYASNLIEGVGVSLSETRALCKERLQINARRIIDPSMTIQQLEAVQHAEAFKLLRTVFVLQQQPLTIEMVCAAHAVLMDGMSAVDGVLVNAGHYRGNECHAGEYRFPPHTSVRSLMGRMVTAYNERSSGSSTFDPFEGAARLSYEFVSSQAAAAPEVQQAPVAMEQDTQEVTGSQPGAGDSYAGTPAVSDFGSGGTPAPQRNREGRSPNTFTPSHQKGRRSLGRPDVGQHNRPNITLPSSMDDGSLASNTVIWGTNINAADMDGRILAFFRSFRDAATDSSSDAGGASKYVQVLNGVIASNETAVNLDTADLRIADPQLYDWLVSYPKEVIPAFDQALRQIAVEELGVDYEYIFIVSVDCKCIFIVSVDYEYIFIVSVDYEYIFIVSVDCEYIFIVSVGCEYIFIVSVDCECIFIVSVDYEYIFIVSVDCEYIFIVSVGCEYIFIMRPFNLLGHKTLRDLDPSDIDKLICVEGMVTRTSTVIPDLRTAYFKCEKCFAVEIVDNDSGKVDEPSRCRGCQGRFTMTMQHNRNTFVNKQLVKMQERPNDIPEGETPHAGTLYVFESNVDVCRPGDRVTITGTYRAAPMRVNPRQHALHALYKTYIDVNHIQRDEKARLFSVAADGASAAATATPTTPGGESSAGPGASESGMPGSQREASQRPTGDIADEQFIALGNMTAAQLKAKEAELKELSKDPNLYTRLVASLAPNIWEMDDVKKGVLCQLFGGVTKSWPGGRIRDNINVLLVGDPSVSKSQLLTYVHALAPRGIYTSGKGSSAVGLTAYVAKDPETREMVLESGALVLSDKGICCIDEFDKMSDSARSMLHEAMEQQTVSVAKAGLISTLNARTSVLACANPVNSRYNPHMSLSENINLPPTLMTRFDLIYLIRDEYNEERDRRLARHLVGLFYEGAEKLSRVQSAELLKEYIAFARARCHPTITDAAAHVLITSYQDMRRSGREKKVIVATPRQLESLIRLSEALARMQLKAEVGPSEVQEAVRLWYVAMQGSSGNRDGTLDLDNVITGTTAEMRQAQKGLPDHILAVLSGLKGTGRGLSVDEVQDALNKAAMVAAGNRSAPVVSRAQVLAVLRSLDAFVLFDENTGVVKPRHSSSDAAPVGAR